MDTRLTLNNKEGFLPVMEDLYRQQKKASVLYDNNGLTRYEGMVKGISKEATSASLLLEGGLKIPLSDLIAVNGIFAPDYSEC